MTKHEFLKSLKVELEKNSVRNTEEILADYEEHFTHGLSKGKSEEKIALGLGFPATIAKAYRAEDIVSEVRNPETAFQWGLAFNAIGRLLLIAPFNFFVLLIPGIIIFLILVGGWTAALSIGASGFAILAAVPVLAVSTAKMWALLAAFSTCFGLLGLSLVIGMIMFLFSKYILLALINYLRWNIKFVTQK